MPPTSESDAEASDARPEHPGRRKVGNTRYGTTLLFLVLISIGGLMAATAETQIHHGSASIEVEPVSLDTSITSPNDGSGNVALQSVKGDPSVSEVLHNAPKEVRAAVTTFTTHTEGNPEPRCGECWCVPDANEVCPSFAPGLYDSYPISWIAALKSFAQSDASPITLEPEGCFPFDVQLDTSRYPEAASPKCNKPPDVTEETVCGFVFPGMEGEDCTGRSYRVQTFANTTDAQAAGALVVHLGPCGVCSNAHDLAVRAETLDTMNPISVLCAAEYVVDADRDNRFENLVNCYKTNTGLTESCARIWAFFGQSNAATCPDFCPVDLGNEIELNLPAPGCGLSECLACSAQAFEDDFNLLAGLWKSPYNAGLLDPVAYPCSFFYRLDDFDPCSGAVLEEINPTQPPSSGAFAGSIPNLMLLWAFLAVGAGGLLLMN